jgi:hypothetical protein
VIRVPATPIPLVEIETIAPPAVAAPPAPIEPLPPQPPVVVSPGLPPLTNPGVQIADGQLSTTPRTKSIQQISLNIEAPPLRSDNGAPMPGPINYAAQTLPLMAQQQPFTRGELIDYGFEWHPAPVGLEFCYQPLYFEEVNVERYGRSLGLFQPLASAASFYGRIPLLPYMVFAKPARRCTYHSHWTLPGYRIPNREPYDIILSRYGAGAEIAVAYGLILLIP